MKFDKKRPPILKIDEKNIKYCSEAKYLGLMIDDRLNYVAHAKSVKN